MSAQLSATQAGSAGAYGSSRWRASLSLVVDIYRLSHQLPREHSLELGTRMRCVVSKDRFTVFIRQTNPDIVTKDPGKHVVMYELDRVAKHLLFFRLEFCNSLFQMLGNFQVRFFPSHT